MVKIYCNSLCSIFSNSKVVFVFLICIVTNSFSQPTNINFQTGNTAGWSVLEAGNADSYLMTTLGAFGPTTQYSVMIPGAVETNSVPLSMISPLGGDFLRLGNPVYDLATISYLNGYVRKLSQTYTVTAASSALSVAYAVILEDGSHPCNEQSYFHFSLKDQFGNTIPTSATYYNICNGSAGASFSSAGIGLLSSNWETHSFDLSAYVGTNVTIEVLASHCIYGGHFGYCYFDAELCSPIVTPNIITIDGVPSSLLQAQNNISICGTTTTTIDAPIGAAGYTWTGTGITGLTTQSVSITQPGTYQLLMDLPSACSPTTAVSFSVGVSPTITVSGSTLVCSGASAILTASGALNYTWTPYSLTMFPVAGLSPTITVTPTLSTTYTITGSSALGCISTETYTVNYAPVPSPTLSIIGYSVICSGTMDTLTVSGADTYTWSTGSNSNSITITPTTSTVYTLTGTSNASGCSSISSKYITVYTNTIGISSPSVAICEGTTAFLLGHGAQTYTWSTGSVASYVYVSPTVTATYSLSGTNVCGTYTSNTTVSVTPISGSISISSPSICAGSSTSLTASGGVSYTWSPSATLSSSNTAVTVGSPTNSLYYSVILTNGSGCFRTYSQYVSVYNSSITTTPLSTQICKGNTVILSGLGAQTYTWNTGSNLSSITVSPSSNTTYTVLGTNPCGTFSSAVAVTVNTISTSISSNPSNSICPTKSTSLTATGGASYVWSPSASLSSSTSSIVASSPTISTIYTLTATSSAGCVKTNTVLVYVSPIYTITSSASQPSICIGKTSTLSVNGALNYTWTPSINLSSASGSVVVASPSTTVIYTITAANALGCIQNQTQNLILYPDFNVNINSILDENCANIPVSLVANIVPAGTYNYNWYPTTMLNSGSIFNPDFTTSLAGQYDCFLIVTDQYGCIKGDTTSVKIVLCEIKVYSGFSPNGDNYNDTWIIDGIERAIGNEVVILNKWGQVVWEIKDYNNADRVFKGNNKTGEALTDGTYFYVLTTAAKTYKGRVEIIR